MLVLKRQDGEAIHINDNIKLIVHIQPGQKIKIAVSAPKDVRVLRQELIKQQPEKNHENQPG